MSKENRVYIVLSETVTKSWMRDIGSYALIVAVIGTGVYLESAAMQWVGFVMLGVGAVLVSVHGCPKALTADQAIERIKRLEADGFPNDPA